MAVSLSIINAGTIGNYSDLESKVALWLDRDDLNERIPDFIALMESEANRLLRTVNQEVPDIWVTDSETYLLPSDFRRLRKIYIDGNPDRPLVEMSPVTVPQRYSGDAGIPEAYYIEGRSISFAPPPAEQTAFRVTYFRKIPPLTSAAPSNWMLEEHPDIYLWGTLEQAAIYIRDPDAISLCGQKFQGAIAELQRESRMDRWGGPLVPNNVQQVRSAPC